MFRCVYIKLLHHKHEDASIKMIQGIFEIIQQDYVNDEEIKFIKDLVKVLFLTFDTFIVLNEFDLLIYFFILHCQ